MSLFSKLQRLISDGRTQLEDFHTEIVAQVFRNDPRLTVKWLAELGLTEGDEPDEVIVGTQEELDPLETHDDLGSRPDISIRISRGDSIELIFLESKIGSKEGRKPGMKSQLQRYAEHLSARKNLSGRSLVYITRDFEPKGRPCEPKGVRFEQRRWFDFYQFLKNTESQPSDLIKQLISFMEENNMSQSNQFSALDVLALANFRKARKIMDATMWEGVSDRFKRDCGGVTSRKNSMNHLQEWNHYSMLVKHGQGDQFWITLGYFIDGEAPTAYPEAFVSIEVNPKAAARAEIVAAMLDYVKFKKGKWKDYNLANDHDWGIIETKESLQKFLSDDDHVKRLIEYFNGLLDDVAEFRKRYSKLPWSAQQASSDEE